MITNGFHSRPLAIGTTFRFLLRAKWSFCLIVAAILTTAATPPAVYDQNTDEQYIHIMDLMDRANALADTGKADAAKAKYKEAYKDLLLFKRTHPKWNTSTVEYRLTEISAKIENRATNSVSEPVTKPKTNLEAPVNSTTASKSSVKLLEPGAEPRKQLRLHPKAGDKQTLILVVKMNMEMGGAAAGGSNAIPSIPPISIPADVTVQNVAPNGDIGYQMVFGEPAAADVPGTPPQMAQAMKTAFNGFKGLTTTILMSDRGITKKADVKVPADANPQVRQTMDQMKESMLSMGSPLPDEAIGTGAKWEVKAPVKSSGMTVNQVGDYQLVSVEGDHVSMSFTQSQSAANQKMQNSSMGNVQMNVLQMTNGTTGNLAMDLSKLMPLQATMDSHTEMNSEITAGGKKQPMDMKIGMNISIESR
jgi:hypothetical protein